MKSHSNMIHVALLADLTQNEEASASFVEEQPKLGCLKTTPKEKVVDTPGSGCSTGL